jgi:SepF-like predicted cell division protein (DUF552 family)
MADILPITVALYGFQKEKEVILKAAFANADKWPLPWVLTLSAEEAKVIIIDIASKNDYEEIENLKRNLPKAEIVAFSSEKPPQAKWHLVKQPNGKVSIVGFSHLVLKISHTLKRNLAEASKPKTEAIITPIAEPNQVKHTEVSTVPDVEEFEQESSDMLTFFNKLDSILDSKPNEKRKRFNES